MRHRHTGQSGECTAHTFLALERGIRVIMVVMSTLYQFEYKMCDRNSRLRRTTGPAFIVSWIHFYTPYFSLCLPRPRFDEIIIIINHYNKFKGQHEPKKEQIEEKLRINFERRSLGQQQSWKLAFASATESDKLKETRKKYEKEKLRREKWTRRVKLLKWQFVSE